MVQETSPHPLMLSPHHNDNMSAATMYANHPPSLDLSELYGDVNTSLVAGDWCGTTPYSFNDAYDTTFPSGPSETQPWTTFARASGPDMSLSPFSGPQHPTEVQPMMIPSAIRDSSRPRSSPTTFGQSIDMSWTTSGAMGMYSPAPSGTETPNGTSFPPALFQTYPSTDDIFGIGSISSTPELRRPRLPPSYAPIAPHPAGVAAVEAARRKGSTDDSAEQPGRNPSTVSASSATSGSGTNQAANAGAARKRRRRTPSVAPADLGEDERLLVQLKEDENLPWKDIAARFQAEKGRQMQVAALQMRYKRLRERFRVWEEHDIRALKLAHEYWEKYKWEIISAKMLDFGVQERWPVKHCTRKWQELEGASASMPQSVAMTPSVSHYSSPVERPVQYTFMPLQ